MSTCAVVPIKNLDHAKQRLAGLLSSIERKSLFTAMVEDVLIALSDSSEVDDILVVTDDTEVTALAERRHAKVLAEPVVPGLIEAVTAAAEYLTREGYDRMVFVPGDIPLLSPRELAVMLAPKDAMDGVVDGGPTFDIAPARDLGGSNCVVCSPPNCMEFGFGEDSFRRHLAIARALGIEPGVMKLPGIGLDVDTPADLRQLIAELQTGAIDSHTHQYLKKIQIEERLDAAAEQAECTHASRSQ